MNCHLSRLLLAFRPDELAGDDRAALADHLRTCPTCAAAANAEIAANAAIRKAMLAVPVPTGLRDKLQSDVAARQGAIWRRKASQWAGGILAASLFVAVTVGVLGFLFKPAFSTTALVQDLEREGWTAEETVNNWLMSEGVPPLPKDFQYAYHVAHGTGPVLGMKRPFVLFQNGEHQCRVYVLRRDSVKTPDDGWKEVTGSSFNVMTVEHDGWVYVIAYTSPTLEPFLKPQGPVA
jgi:hypothetical protein